jgi:CubicO group peptidase (beta-lactamase class C family)
MSDTIKLAASQKFYNCKAIFLLAAVLMASLFVFTSARKENYGKRKSIFPGKEWKERTPKNAGVNAEALRGIGQIMERARSNGALIRDGYLVAEWNYGGPENKKFEVQSVTKSIMGIVAGIALKEGKISSLQDKVKGYYPVFNGGPHANEITFYHLLTATSGMPSIRNNERYAEPRTTAPGTESLYHNDHTGELAAALTYIYNGESLADILRRRVTNKIGAEVEWGKDRTTIEVNGKQVPVTPGYAYSHWTAKDLARVGWLYLNNGKWQDQQLLPEDYVKQCMTPVSVPVRRFHRGDDPSEPLKNQTYGYLWWGYYTSSGRLIWYMSGNGGQFCVVLPEENIVFTKINGIGKENQPFTTMEEFEDLIGNLTK